MIPSSSSTRSAAPADFEAPPAEEYDAADKTFAILATAALFSPAIAFVVGFWGKVTVRLFEIAWGLG